MVATNYIARGDEGLDFQIASLPSPIRSADSPSWSRFVRALSTKDLDHVSTDGSLGCFEMRPRRLGDIGIMTNLRRGQDTNRAVWEGNFVLPLTKDRFLDSPVVQYNALVLSVTDHDLTLKDLPEGVTRSGALAILHQAGPWGLSSWRKGNRREDTILLFNHTNGIF